MDWWPRSDKPVSAWSRLKPQEVGSEVAIESSVEWRILFCQQVQCNVDSMSIYINFD